MRKTAITLLALGLAASFVGTTASAALLSETFSYPDGNLTVVSPWTNHSSPTGTDIKIVSGRAVGTMSNTPDDNRTFAGTTAKIYSCFELTIPTPLAAPDTGYIAHFKDTGTSNF